MVSQQLALQAFNQATKNFGTTKRYREATRAEMYYWSLQYDGLYEWEQSDQKLHQRKPKIILPLYKEVIDGIQRFVWGGHRFPRVVIGATDGADQPNGLTNDIGPIVNRDQAAQLTAFLAAVVGNGKLRATAAEFSRVALVGTHVAVVVGAREGYLTCHVEPGKDGTPTWAKNGRDLEKLEIVKQHEKDAPDGMGRTRLQKFWYRRVIDAERDVVYKEVPVRALSEPEWEEDPEKTVAHGFGFCPAKWIRTFPHSMDAIEGVPVIDPKLYFLIDEVNYTLSLKNRAVQYSNDPQVVRRGVPIGERKNLIKESGRMWDIPAEGDIKYLEALGSGVEKAKDHIAALTSHFREACSYVKADPDKVRGDISGVVLEFLHAPMLALAADLRSDLGEDGYVGVLNLALRVVSAIAERGEAIWLPGISQAQQIIQTAQKAGVWLDFPIQIQWPPYFADTVTDQQVKAGTAASAKEKGLITSATATRYVASVFAIENPEEEAAAADAELAARTEAQTKASTPEPPPVAPGAAAPAPAAKGSPAEPKKPTKEDDDA